MLKCGLVMSELHHYGVLGMRWGVRKDRDLGVSKRPPNKSSEYKSHSPNGDSVVHVRGKKDFDKLVQTAKQYEQAGRLATMYGDETENARKLSQLTRARMTLSNEQQLLATNHNAPNQERRVNCFECTMAYEMRNRGYVVQANEVNGGFGFQAPHAFNITDSFTIETSSPKGSKLDPKTLAAESYRKLEEQCLTYGEGARGMLGITYANGSGGHAMSWFVKDGEFHLVDPQSNRVEAYDSYIQSDGKVEVYRLDNAEVLPGVMDFVEEFEMSEEEKERDRERIEELKRIREKAELIRGTDGYRDRGNWTDDVKRIAKDIAKRSAEAIKDLIQKGKDLIDDIFTDDPKDYHKF